MNEWTLTYFAISARAVKTQDGKKLLRSHLWCPIDTARLWDRLDSTILKYLSIGTPTTINFSFVSNGKLMVFRYPNIQAHYTDAVIYLNFETSKNYEFFIWNKWKIYYFRCLNT